MGNRAVITTAPFNRNNVGIYVHWNGGRDSIESFLETAKRLNYRSPAQDETYAMARLVSIIAALFGPGSGKGSAGLSLGIGRCDELDCDSDNGVYLIGGNWEIVGRMNSPSKEQAEYDVNDTASLLVARIKAADAVKEVTA